MIGKIFKRETSLTVTRHNETTGAVIGINDSGAEIILTLNQLNSLYQEDTPLTSDECKWGDTCDRCCEWSVDCTCVGDS